MKSRISIFLIILFFLLATASVSAQNSSGGGNGAIPGEEDQASRRSSKKFFVGGFIFNKFNGLNWIGFGYQFSSKLAISFQGNEQRRISRFDLDLIGAQGSTASFTLTNSEEIQRQAMLQLEWFPFANPYYVGVGAGTETFSKIERTTNTSTLINDVKYYDWSLLQKRTFASIGAGFRYLFPSGFFVHLGGNFLGYLGTNSHPQHGAYISNSYWDPASFEKAWKSPNAEAKDHQNAYGMQLQVLVGISF
ncbi:hypothetical protein CH373_17635 [Leptospira perolatii]|uniref:Outer membrane protein beta-barrel domain-containing protein n=1 Tax=Leptospira perolatii TaxID=2023191 RepID=A0A2M9ZIM0_9LEPT|nr:hypothetical protein [Leptospira perolatii]PJZ69094.1 hypothetical protein CH360_12480 [Leptospira perolatii]PJZ71803.1 hypothetical protein CH373_17635 [Leptospira perolatii]